MNAHPTPSKITLEEITHRKEEVLREILMQKQQMTDTAQSIFAPLAAVGSAGNAFMRTFSTGMAVFDGAMLGLKIIRKIRGLFRK